ncbi:MAG TPA: hypothetical protein V6D19_12500 [Stenomitos sp.]
MHASTFADQFCKQEAIRRLGEQLPPAWIKIRFSQIMSLIVSDTIQRVLLAIALTALDDGYR